MPVEGDFDNIDSLDPTFPFNDDEVSEGPQHLRGIKQALQGNVAGDDTVTQLLVNALVKAFVDEFGLTVLDSIDVLGQTISINQLVASMVAELKLQNLTGGWGFINQGDTSELLLLQFDAAGALEKVMLTVNRDGALVANFNGAASLQTADRAVGNSAAQVFDAAGVPRSVGFNTLTNIPGNVSFTIAVTHNGARVRTNGAITITLDQATLFPIGGCTIVGNFSGTTNIVTAGGAELQFYTGETRVVGNRVLNIGGTAFITRVSAATWEIWGNGLDIP